jgi:hypothetical protein
MILLPFALLFVTLVDQGKSSYTIRLPADAIPAEHRAAEELQTHLEQMSGARLPIDAGARSPRIVLRHDPALGPETFRLRTSGRDLLISGGRPRGLLYGAYTLLEKLGVRWYTSEVRRIPRLPTIRLDPMEETQSPAFEYREPFFTEAFDRDWAARNKTNGDHSLLDDSTGGKLVYYPFVHSFYQLLPPDKYFKDHPEYYSLIDGRRRWERGQLCLTNPEVLRLAVETVRGWIRRRPDASIYSVSQNDWEGWCECDNCRRVEQEEGGKHSGPVLRFVNAVAAEIEKEHPEKLIDTLAYWYTEEPPARARPRRNVRVRLCPIGVCQAHPYEKCPHSAYFVQNLRAWSRITDQLYIWHYNTNFSHYLIPFPDFDELAADIPMYRRSGVKGLFMEGAYPKGGGGENAELRSWVMARQLWNPAVNVDQAVSEFLDGVYGPAARAMRAYFDLLHRQARNGLHIWINPVPEYSDDFLREAAALHRRAEAAAGDDQALLRRIRKSRLSIDYLELLRAKTLHIRGDQYTPAGPASLQSRFRPFLDDLRSFGITSIHEGRNLDFTEKEFAACRPYRLVAHENDTWRLDLAPELGGRIIRLLHKPTSRDLLRRVNSGERGYPDLGGLGVFAYPDFHSRASTPLQWRDIRLTAGTVELDASLDQAGPLLQARLELDATPIDQLRFIQPDQPPVGSEACSGGEFRLRDVVIRVPADQVERCQLSWTAKGPHRVTYTFWSRQSLHVALRVQSAGP